MVLDRAFDSEPAMVAHLEERLGEGRSQEEIDHWKGRDPVLMHRQWILDEEIAGEAEVVALEANVQALVESAAEFAKNSPYPDGDTAIDLLMANTPSKGQKVRLIWAHTGIGGTPVAITNSGLLGAFSATYAIPPTLMGARQIAIRLESPQGYFSYNWFWNNLAEPAPTPIPTLSIESVVVDETVTIRTHNFPADRTFVLLMGHMGTLGIDGTPVGTFYSGLGGTMTATFPIPVNLKGLERIAIRAAAEAVIELLGRTDGERRRFFAMERAKAQQVGAGLAQLHVLTHHIDDVGAGQQVLNE